MKTLPKSLSEVTLVQACLIALLVSFATIAGAWIFQWAGYLPCELCLKQRWAYYAGVPVAALATLLAAGGQRRLAASLLAIFAVIFVGSAIFGAYHAGVEWGFWKGPTDCTGTYHPASNMDDFLHRLETEKVVRCDAVAIRILGLSLAGWNCVISAALAIFSADAVRRALRG